MARTIVSNHNTLNQLKKNLAAALVGVEGLPTDIDIVNEITSFLQGKIKPVDVAEPKDKKTTPADKGKKPSYMQRRKAAKTKK